MHTSSVLSKQMSHLVNTHKKLKQLIERTLQCLAAEKVPLVLVLHIEQGIMKKETVDLV